MMGFTFIFEACHVCPIFIIFTGLEVIDRQELDRTLGRISEFLSLQAPPPTSVYLTHAIAGFTGSSQAVLVPSATSVLPGIYWSPVSARQWYLWLWAQDGGFEGETWNSWFHQAPEARFLPQTMEGEVGLEEKPLCMLGEVGWRGRGRGAGRGKWLRVHNFKCSFFSSLQLSVGRGEGEGEGVLEPIDFIACAMFYSFSYTCYRLVLINIDLDIGWSAIGGQWQSLCLICH